MAEHLSPMRLTARRFFRNRQAVIGLCILGAMILFCFLGGIGCWVPCPRWLMTRDNPQDSPFLCTAVLFVQKIREF